MGVARHNEPARRTQDHQHFTTVDHALQVPQDIDLPGLLAANELLDGAHDLEKHIAHALLVVCRGAEAKDVEILESEASCASFPFFRILCLQVDQGLDESSRAEIRRVRVEFGVFGGLEGILIVRALARLRRELPGELVHFFISSSLLLFLLCLGPLERGVFAAGRDVGLGVFDFVGRGIRFHDLIFIHRASRRATLNALVTARAVVITIEIACPT